MADVRVDDAFSAAPPAVIAKALVAIQRDLSPLLKSATNDEFDSSFVPLEEVTMKAHQLLKDHKIALLQPPSQNEHGHITMDTILVHEDGESFMRRTRLVMGDKTSPQGHASALTYMRRYALMGTLGLTGRGEDDDGNKASGVFAPVTEEQKDRLRSLMKHLKYPKTSIASEMFNIKTRDHAYLAIKNFETTVAQKARDEESKQTASEIEFGKKIEVTDTKPVEEEVLDPLSPAALEKRIKALGLRDQAAENKFVYRMVNKAFLKNVKDHDDFVALERAITLIETGTQVLPAEFYPPATEPRLVNEDVA